MDPAVKIDVYDPDIYEQGIPYDSYDWLRANSPVYWHDDPQGPGFWAITRHADVVQVSRHPELFSSFARTAMLNEFDDDAKSLQQLIMLNQDPPQHTRTRKLVNRGFTPRMISKLEDHIRDICEQLVADALRAGEVDFVHDVAAPLPLNVICELLGAPVEDREKVFHWSNQMVGFDDPEYFGQGTDAAAEVFAWAAEMAEQRRATPRDDILTKLITPDESGQELTPDEFGMFVTLLIVAGNETTRNATSGGMLALLEHPDQWNRLRADPSVLKTAPDEIVRWVAPVIEFRRTCMQDTEIRGQRIAAGDKVVVFYHSANRDEEVFSDPYRFNVARDPNPHVGFGGGGPHFCLGSHLALLELRVLFQTLARRISRIELTGNVRRLRSNFINGIKEMPVGFTVAPRET